MKKAHFIVGCGYTGLVLARDLVSRGERVIGTTRDPKRLDEIAATGAEPQLFSFEQGIWPKAHLQAVYVLATAPPEPDAVFARGEFLMRHLADVPTVVVVSTGLYGRVDGIVTEMTLPRPKTPRERALALWDATVLHMRQSQGTPISVVRTPAIYGPERCFKRALQSGEAKVLLDAPLTSRIHVADLASLLRAMATKSAPPILLACDEEAAPTRRVMDEAARLLGLAGPRRISASQAHLHFSARGLEMRRAGRNCVSQVRAHLQPQLRFPTYREGLRGALGVNPDSP